MEFSRVGDHTIKCIISEEEIGDMGYTLDEIMSNGAKTQEFMNYIFDLAEQEFQMKFDLGVKTVRADFLPDHTLALTFSEHPMSRMVEHLKDIFNGIINSIPQEKWEEIRRAGMEAEEQGSNEKEEQMRIIVLFTFRDMDTVMQFSRHADLEPVPPNALYKHRDKYIMVMDLTGCGEAEVLRLSVLTDEFAEDIQVGPEKQAFLKEHGTVILKERSIENLREV